MKLYRIKTGCVVESGDQFYAAGNDWDALVRMDDLEKYLQNVSAGVARSGNPISNSEELPPPIGSQEVWAAGVTYYRSRDARMEEAKIAGGGDFYDRVYNAERPELFFKATANRVVGHYGKVAIRRDAKWSVPEPELTLMVSPTGKILGYTIGNDMSSRDIEGENPLYLPQAKVYNRSCSLGPGVLISSKPLAASTKISLVILRSGEAVFSADRGFEWIEAKSGNAGRISLSRQCVSKRMFPAYRNRHRAARFVHAESRR